ncbi:flagellar biosynthetic protein FliR [Desulfobacterales bacterium HSG17]|nr:flagellar biosynthetic protein FliR [Desulfobacterales bacterium HSG17]
MTGLTLGLCLRIFFASVQLAGQVIGFQIAGARARMVKRAIISRTTATSSGVVAVSTFNCKDGMGNVKAKAEALMHIKNRQSSKVILIFISLPLLYLPDFYLPGFYLPG